MPPKAIISPSPSPAPASRPAGMFLISLLFRCIGFYSPSSHSFNLPRGSAQHPFLCARARGLPAPQGIKSTEAVSVRSPGPRRGRLSAKSALVDYSAPERSYVERALQIASGFVPFTCLGCGCRNTCRKGGKRGEVRIHGAREGTCDFVITTHADIWRERERERERERDRDRERERANMRSSM